MKNYLIPGLLVAAFLTSQGCVYRRTVIVDQPNPAVVTTVHRTPTTVTTVPGTTKVYTALPSGYTTTVYRGTTYYTYGNVYYRSAPGGYIIVERPY